MTNKASDESSEERTCPHCESTGFGEGRCTRCGRPIIQDPAYVNDIESLAWDVVGFAFDEYPNLRSTAADGSELQRAIVRLANRLRHYHYEGDGCLDERQEPSL